MIRCEHDSTRYDKDDSTKRLSCVTPLSYPQPGSETTTLTYKFVCKTSCPSGMDRKPISVIFTLEDIKYVIIHSKYHFFKLNFQLLSFPSGYVFGRQPLAVKICSCPKRDKLKEEHNETQKTRTPKVTRARSSTSDSVSIRNSRGASTSNQEHLKDLQVCFSSLSRWWCTKKRTKRRPCDLYRSYFSISSCLHVRYVKI